MIKTKVQLNIIIRDTLSYKNKKGEEIKDGEKMYKANTKQKNARVAVLIFDKAGLEPE